MRNTARLREDRICPGERGLNGAPHPRVLHLSSMKVTFEKVFTEFQNRCDYTDFNQFFPLNTYAIPEMPSLFLNSLIKHFILHLKLTVEFSHKFNLKNRLRNI